MSSINCIGGSLWITADTRISADVLSGCRSANSIDDGPPAEIPTTATCLMSRLFNKSAYASTCAANEDGDSWLLLLLHFSYCAEVVGSNPTRSIFSCYGTTVLF